MIRGEHRGKPWAIKMGIRGVSDIVGFRRSDGRIVCIECKREGASPTPEQRAFLDAVRAAGGIAAVVHSAAEAVEALR